MAEDKVILITGVANQWGARVASELIKRSKGINPDGPRVGEGAAAINLRVMGLDIDAPDQEIDGLDFIQADIRNPSFPDLLKSENIHTVCHLNFAHSYHRSEQAFDFNVLGTMKVFGACAESGVKKLILKSSTSVYGARPKNPAFLSENHDLNGSKNNGYSRDLVEIASFCTGFCAQEQDMMLTVLRFPSIIGTSVDTPMTRYLSKSPVPVLMGFDPRMQLIQEEDVVDAVIHSIDNDVPGIFNVAAPDIIPLRKMIGLAGKLPLPIFHPFAYLAADVTSAIHLPTRLTALFDWDYLRYSWVADTTRMLSEMKFTPKYTAVEALQEFDRQQKLSKYEANDPSLVLDDQYLSEILKTRARHKSEMDQVIEGRSNVQ